MSHRCPFLVVLLDKSMAIPGLPGGLIIYQGHLFPLNGHLCRGDVGPGVWLDKKMFWGFGVRRVFLVDA